MLFLRRLFVTFAVLVLALGSQASANPMLLIDTDSGAVLFEQEAGAAWHPASLTKLMTAFVAFQAISEGRVGLDTPVIISKRAFNQAPSLASSRSLMPTRSPIARCARRAASAALR